MWYLNLERGMLRSEHNDKDQAIADLIRLGLAAAMIDEISLSKIELVLLRSLGSNLAFVNSVH